MATRHATAQPTTEQRETPAEIALQVVPVGAVVPPPTLDEAFMLLCRAMVETLESLPDSMHAEEIMGWHTNGNTAIAWQHAVLLLERAIGVPLRG